MFQQLVILGSLGRDPEMRYTPSGKAFTMFDVATNRKWTGDDGTSHDDVTWFKVTTWGRLAEACNEYLDKGQTVLVSGVLKPDPATGYPRIWMASDGTSRASYEVTARVVHFLGRRESEPQDGDELDF